MPLSKSAKDAVFDIILKDALINSCNKDIEPLENQESNHEFSKGFERKVTHIKSSINRKNIIMKSATTTAKVLVSAAAVMGIVFGGLLTEPSVSAAVKNVFIDIFNTHDRYTVDDKSLEIDEFDKDKQLFYVPDKYEISNINYTFFSKTLTYENYFDELTLTVSYYLAEGATLDFDNEHGEYIIINRGEQEYYHYEFTEYTNSNKTIWYKDGYLYSITSQLDIDEIVKIAENIMEVIKKYD